MNKFFLIACILTLIIPLYAETKEDTFEPSRTWTSADGSSTFKGRVLKYDGEKVTISAIGKAPVVTSIDKFSEEDKQWLEERKDYIGVAKAGTPLACKVGLALDELKQLNPREAKLKKNAKYYFLLLSASWCPPCRGEAPKVVKEYNNVISKNPDIELVLLGQDRNEESALEWIKKEKMPYPYYLDKGKYNDIPGVEGNRGGGIPHAIIVDKDGKMLYHAHAAAVLAKYKEYCK